MRNVHRSTLTAATIAAMAVLSLSACSNDSSTAESEATAAETTSSAAAPTTQAMAEPAANLVGSGCAAYAEQVPEGPGSVAGMSQNPVTVAASNNPMLKTLTQALSGQLNPNVNLIDTLNGGEFTVFAPTDDAFAKLPAGTLDTLLADPKGDLTDILTYHVVPGEVMAAQVLELNGQKVKTVQGAELTVNVEGSNVSLTDAAGNTVNVTQTDVAASNGVIHVIDGVLLPTS